MTAPLLEIIDLHKRYGETVALQSVRFQVEEGEMFGLLGPNGAGKTTLLSITSCLRSPTGGEVRILGTKVSPQNKELRRLIGIVPQELALYGELSARENLVFFGRLYGIPREELRKRVNEVLDAVGLSDRSDNRVDTFSGGMMRRLNIGAALVHRPKLLLLDEPTTGVDPQSRNHIFEEVRRLNQLGMTVVYTSHYMEEVQALCSRIGIMDHGRLIACDTLPMLLQTMSGTLRFQLSRTVPNLEQRINSLPGIQIKEQVNGTWELECRDVKATVLRLVALLHELQLELTFLETEEPNLERVFLHLTGRVLRD